MQSLFATFEQKIKMIDCESKSRRFHQNRGSLKKASLVLKNHEKLVNALKDFGVSFAELQAAG